MLFSMALMSAVIVSVVLPMLVRLVLMLLRVHRSLAILFAMARIREVSIALCVSFWVFIRRYVLAILYATSSGRPLSPKLQMILSPSISW